MSSAGTNPWLGFAGYVALWVWLCSPWVRFAMLPGLMPNRGIPFWVWPWG